MGSLPAELRNQLGVPSTEPESGFDRLDGLIEEARAGAPDTWLMEKAQVSARTVQRWRRHNNVSRPRGRRRKQDLVAWAIDVFGDGYNKELHTTKSRVLGKFELPEFVLREALDYDALCKTAWELFATCGYTAEEISRAFGIREKDIAMALELQSNRLKTLGKDCPSCGYPMDPSSGRTTCSKACR